MVRAYVWSIVLFGSETWKIGTEVFGELEMWCWRRMEKIKWSERVTNEQAIERIAEKRTLLNNTLLRKDNWVGHILRRNCLFRVAIERPMTEMKGMGRGRRRITQLIDI